MENFLALLAIVVGSAVLGLVLAYGMRWQRETHRPPSHDDASPKF
ncbi:hypothetical protein [Sinorhizobium sp. BG8]|nr:hypothetical protein [Sinorhizobium sp. BG8]